MTEPTTEAGRALFLRRLSRAIDDDRQYQQIVDEFDRLQAQARATADAEIRRLREALDKWRNALLDAYTLLPPDRAVLLHDGTKDLIATFGRRPTRKRLLADKPVGAGDTKPHKPHQGVVAPYRCNHPDCPVYTEAERHG